VLAFEPIQDGRIYIEKINGPFLYVDRGTPAEYSAGLKLAIERGWLEIHDSGTFVKFHGVRRRSVRLKNSCRMLECDASVPWLDRRGRAAAAPAIDQPQQWFQN